MARPKERDAKKVNLFLDLEINEKLEKFAESEKMGKSAFVEFLVGNWDEGSDPTIRLNNLMAKKENIIKNLNDIETEIKKVTEMMSQIHQWNKIKGNKKEKAVKVIEKIILRGDFEQAERSSKTWQAITGIPSTTLLFEAKDNIEKKGI